MNPPPKKETLAQVFSCEFCEIFKNTFFIKHLRWLLLKKNQSFRALSMSKSRYIASLISYNLICLWILHWIFKVQSSMYLIVFVQRSFISKFEWSPSESLFQKSSDSIVELMVSITSGVSMWVRPCN